MANPEHVSLLKEGVAKWNAWRMEAPMISPDLIAANFQEASLRGVDLTDTQLNGTYFERADLTEAKLMVAANLMAARLQGSDMKGARLTWANLSYADLSGADLESALFESTVLGATNLSGARGLERCEHLDRSIIDHQTVLISGALPLAFLRGCGLAEDLITFIPRLLPTFYSCFISYSSQDQVFAERLHTDLQNHGIRCWYAPKDLRIGKPIRIGIDESIRNHDKLLLIMSRKAVNSPWVEKEVETALEEERKQKRIILFPIRLDNSVLKTENGWTADIRRARNIGDFTRWTEPGRYESAFDRLLRDLAADAQPCDV